MHLKYSDMSSGWLATVHELMSRMGFLTRIKSKKVEIGKERTSKMIVKGKLSERAVMKENGLRQVYLQEKNNTKRNLVRAITKSKSRTQTVTNGHVGHLSDESSC